MGLIPARWPNPAKAIVQTHTPQTIPSGSSLFVEFDQIVINNGPFNLASPTRLTALVQGQYLVVMYAEIGTAGPPGYTYMSIRKNGATSSDGIWVARDALNDSTLAYSDVVDLVAGDYIELELAQDQADTETLNIARIAFYWMDA